MNTPQSLPAYTDAALANLDTDELIELLARDEDRVPRNVIDECARRGEDMVARLSGLNEGGRGWEKGAAPGEWWLLLHAPMILGLIPSESAGLLLVRFMRRMSEDKDDNLQDWLSGRWPALFRNKPEAAADSVRRLSENREFDWYIRANAVDVMIAAARHRGDEALDRALDWLARIAADEQED